MKKDVQIFKGGENFAEIIENGAYYVDKTSYLKNIFITDSVKNPLFIRPRRFGKTLNLNMIKEFCEINYKNPGDKARQQKLFIDNGRNFAVAGDDYKELREKIMGEFPVISFSFRGVEGREFYSSVDKMLLIIAELYENFLFLSDSKKQTEEKRKAFREIYGFCLEQHSNLTDTTLLKKAESICGSFVAILASMLHKEYDKPVIVMIDEYDVPLQKSVVAEHPYYEKMLEIIKQISVTTFKQSPDPWLYKGIVSGCLKIAHQSVFTDANNFSIYGMDDEIYSGFFGFTEDETQKLLSDCGISNKDDEVKSWYDGYRFAGKHIYCPWSLTSYCYEFIGNKDSSPKAFWVNTSGNDIISLFTDNSMESHNADNIDKLQKLLEEETIDVTLKDFTTYPDIRNKVSFDVFMTLMLHTGYVTFAEGSSYTGKVSLRIPNKEVLTGFIEKRDNLFGEDNPYWYNRASMLVDFLMGNKTDEAQSLISSMLKEFLSIRNTSHELYYHGFMTGVIGLACATKGIVYLEDTENGDGFSDIILDSYDTETVCILELKRTKELEDSYDAAVAATEQIIKKDYAGSYISKRYKKVYGIGIGFAKKSCRIVSMGNLVK